MPASRLKESARTRRSIDGNLMYTLRSFDGTPIPSNRLTKHAPKSFDGSSAQIGDFSHKYPQIV